MMNRLIVSVSLASVAFSLSAAPAVPQNPARIREIAALLPEKAGFPQYHISNRAVWDRIAKACPGAVKEMESYLRIPPEPIDDREYTNQTVEIWGPINGRRSRLLPRLVKAECCENKGRFIPRIIAQMEAINAQTTWMNPYHDRPKFGNFYKKYNTVDLNTSENAMNMAMAVDCLRGKLPEKLVAETLKKCWDECFTSYLATAHGKGYNGWFFGESNWNAACHSQTLAAALRLVDDRMTRAEFIEGAERGKHAFLNGNGFTSEGYCQEGIDYWNYGYGRFLSLGLTVRVATGGKVDFFKDPKAKRCFTYAPLFQLAPFASPQFGDGATPVSASALSLAEIPYPEEARSTYGARVNPWDGYLESVLLRCFEPGYLEVDRTKFPPIHLPVRTFYEEAQVYFGRQPKVTDDSMSVCIKGGHNGVPHNHNDAGQYEIALGSVQIIEDPAQKPYDFDSFGPKRYHSAMRNSYGHATPYLSKTYVQDFGMQKTGVRYSARVRSVAFAPERDLVMLDLAGAYGDGRVKQLDRNLVFDRRTDTVTVEDIGAFTEPIGYQTAISTYGTVAPTSDANVFTVTRVNKRFGTKKLTFRVDTHGAKWHPAIEKIPNPKRVDPTRFGIVFDEPVAAAHVTVTYNR